MMRFADDSFKGSFMSTVGIDFVRKPVHMASAAASPALAGVELPSDTAELSTNGIGVKNCVGRK